MIFFNLHYFFLFLTFHCILPFFQQFQFFLYLQHEKSLITLKIIQMKTKQKISIIPLIIMGIFLLFSYSCKDDDNSPAPTAQVPVLTTAVVSSITTTTAKSGGNISSAGVSAVTARGVCWSTAKNPTISNSKTTDGAGIGSFTSNISGLTDNTTYYLRAYATNSAGTGYGNSITFTTTGGSGNVNDIDGNVYHPVTIGTQTWMVENLKTTKYNDGSAIPNVTDSSSWPGLKTPAYCWYKNDQATYKATYGGLYNWYAVNTKKLCPTGWHVPSDAEWTTLKTFVNDGSGAGARLKEASFTHWKSPNEGATNYFGFTALPGGQLSDIGNFIEIGMSGYWWTTDEAGPEVAWNRIMAYDHPLLVKNTCPFGKVSGYSVRCIKD
jgi:uncharacterized protein (TIGR02145 family)